MRSGSQRRFEGNRGESSCQGVSPFPALPPYVNCLVYRITVKHDGPYGAVIVPCLFNAFPASTTNFSFQQYMQYLTVDGSGSNVG